MSYSIPAVPLNVTDEVKVLAALARARLNAADRAQLRALLEPPPGPNPDGAVAPTQIFTDVELAAAVPQLLAFSAFTDALQLEGWTAP